MSSPTRVTTPFEFIFVSIFALICSILNLIILKKEYYKRKYEHINFISNATKYTSFLCIIFGTLYTITTIFAGLQSCCFIGRPLQVIFSPSQAIFMGFNQISRLFYCFSQKKVYSTKGYPTWLFIIMVSIGILLFLHVCVFPWIFINELCGTFNTHNTGKYPYIAQMIYAPNMEYWINIGMTIYLLWDITTLSLYVFKVLSFKKFKNENITIHNRIMSILKQIVILTILYEIGAIWCLSSSAILGSMETYGDVYESGDDHDQAKIIIASISYRCSWCFAAVMFNVSIFLMQQHNLDKYEEFLRIMYTLKVHYVCCGCRDVFVDAVEIENVLQLPQKITVVSDTRTLKLQHSNPGDLNKASMDMYDE